MSMITKHKEIEFHVGDTIRVHYRIIEKEKVAGKTKKSVKEEVKERVQPFEGVVMGIKGAAENKSFTVRRLGAANIGIERVFPLISPWIEKVEVTRRGVVRRAKLNYLRGKSQMDVKQPTLTKTARKPRRGRSSGVPTKKRVSRT